MEIKELRLSRQKSKHKKFATWPPEKRIEVVSQYLVLGNMALVSATTGVPHQLIRAWKALPWWKDIENQVRATENLQMDTKLSKIVERSLDAVLDRVEHGEVMYDKKTGQTYRSPVTMKDAAKVSVDLITKRELLRGNATERRETTQVSVADQLKELALEFAKWQKPQQVIDVETVEVIDNQKDTEDAIYEEREEGLQEGSSEVYEQTGSSQEEDGTEQSPSDHGESWQGS